MRTRHIAFFLVLTLTVAAQAQEQWNGATTGVLHTSAKVGIGTNEPGSFNMVVQSTDHAMAKIATTSTGKYAFSQFLLPANSTIDYIAAGVYFQGRGGF